MYCRFLLKQVQLAKKLMPKAKLAAASTLTSLTKAEQCPNKTKKSQPIDHSRINHSSGVTDT